MTKLGPHVLNPTTAALDWAKRAPIVKTVNRIDALKVAPPNAIRVFRQSYDNEMDTTDPHGTISKILAGLKGYEHPNLYIQIWCGAHPTRDQLTTAVGILHDLGLKTVGSSWFTGDYIQADWDAAVAAKVDAFGPQAYWGNSGFTLDHAVHYRRFWVNGQPPVLILECGRDQVEGGKGGWKKDGVSADYYTKELLAYDAEISKDAYVLGATPFSSGPTPDWAAFDMDPISPHLPSGGNVPNVGQGFQKCVPLIGQFIEDEIYHAPGTAQETSLAITSAGYAVYRKATNETIAYHQDGRIWADGGNHQDGTMRQVRGPF